MTDHDAIAARARDHIARGGSPYIAPSEYLDLYDEVKRLRAERDALRDALANIAVMGFDNDPAVSNAIAKSAVNQARAALKGDTK